MKLKRVTAVLLAGVMAMGLVACGSGSDTAAKDPGGKDSIEDDRTCDRKDFRTNTEDLSFFFIFNGRRSDSVCEAGDGNQCTSASPFGNRRINVKSG